MRWRLGLGGEFLRYVDADFIRDDRIRGREFIASDAVVLTISPFVYVTVTPVPTMRLVGGPRDGQVAAAPDGDLPFCVFFLPVVALNEQGEAIAPVAPGRLGEIAETYLHMPSHCPCWAGRRAVWEHVYVWPRDADGERSVEVEHGGAPV